MSTKRNILIGCTGSVATIKLPVIIELLKSQTLCTVRVCLTEKAKHFCSLDSIKGVEFVYTDDTEWSSWSKRGDPVLHIDLVKWADILVIAPLDANTLSKVGCGLCDNMLTCIVRAWDLSKPLLFCPAMNTKMWEHPITNEQIKKLKSWGYIEVPCISKTLMCGDTGLGAMAEPREIVTVILKNLESKD